MQHLFGGKRSVCRPSVFLAVRTVIRVIYKITFVATDNNVCDFIYDFVIAIKTANFFYRGVRRNKSQSFFCCLFIGQAAHFRIPATVPCNTRFILLFSVFTNLNVVLNVLESTSVERNTAKIHTVIVDGFCKIQVDSQSFFCIDFKMRNTRIV